MLIHAYAHTRTHPTEPTHPQIRGGRADTDSDYEDRDGEEGGKRGRKHGRKGEEAGGQDGAERVPAPPPPLR